MKLLGRGAVPVLFAGCDAHDVAGADSHERPAACLDVALAFGDEERLAVGVVMPGGVGAWREVHGAERPRRSALVGGDGVDEHVAGEPVGRPLHRGVLGLDFHVSLRR